MHHTPLAERLAALIARDGPMRIDEWMSRCNAHYYGSRDPLGARGDFVTAPEVSQMFGELIGLWLGDLAMRAEARDAVFVELGPGRGTLAADALRALRSVGLSPEPHLVETSPALTALQRTRLPEARHHATLDPLPGDRPLLAVANEFFDALPVRQLVNTGQGWRERVVARGAESFTSGVGGKHALTLEQPAAIGDVFEIAPARASVCADLAARIADQGGAALIVDYGHLGPALGDSLQAVRAHAFADPFARPGEHDLTAHVDFAPLLAEGRRAGLRVHGPAAQGEFLERLGLSARAAALAKAQPARAGELALAQARLAGPEQMGTLFKAIAFTAPGWPDPEGFA